MKILIVGAGIGGCTLAAFLKDTKLEFDIVDRSADWSQHGYSLGLWNNGRSILKKLGIENILDTHGVPIHTYIIRDGKGKLLKKFNLHDFYIRYGIAYMNISRDLLHETLLARSGTHVKMNCSIVSLKQIVDAAGAKDYKVIVTFSDGTTGEYDLVVGADGVHSKVRELAFDMHAIEHYDNQRIWYTWLDKKYTEHATITDYVGAGEFMSAFDCGSRALLVMVAPVEHTIWDDESSRIDKLKKALAHQTLITSGALDALSGKDVSPTNLEHIRMKKWVKGNVVLLGDAAHAFEPHAGLGGSMAMEDGYVLAAELMKVSDSYSLSDALARYELVRKSRVTLARKLTNRMRCWTLIKSKLLRKIVNIAIPYIPESFFVAGYYRLLDEDL